VIVVDCSVWIDFFNGVSTPEVEQLDGLLGVTPVAIGDLILVEVVQPAAAHFACGLAVKRAIAAVGVCEEANRHTFQ